VLITKPTVERVTSVSDGIGQNDGGEEPMCPNPLKLLNSNSQEN
jgi:hypothetical protein